MVSTPRNRFAPLWALAALLLLVLVAAVAAVSADRASASSATKSAARNAIKPCIRLEKFGAADFPRRPTIDNRYLPMRPGTQLILEGAVDGVPHRVVFTVTDQPFTATGTQLNAAAAARLLSQGVNALPREFDTLSFSDSHHVTALIYEFRKGTTQGDVSTLTPSRLGARAHLEKSGIYQALAVR